MSTFGNVKSTPLTLQTSSKKERKKEKKNQEKKTNNLFQSTYLSLSTPLLFLSVQKVEIKKKNEKTKNLEKKTPYPAQIIC